MKTSRLQVAILAAAVALVAVATVVQGRWTERWVPISRDEVIAAARLLEERFPTRFGEWELLQELQQEPKQLQAAGAVGHISREYRNDRTRAPVSAFVVCALPYDASAHTPDRCYLGAGFKIVESEHRVEITCGDGQKAEALTGTFSKDNRTLRIYWTYGVKRDGGLKWIAPQFPRIALQSEPSVYKLYAIMEQTRVGKAQSMVECEGFIAQLAPALDAALAATGGPASSVPPAAEPGESPEAAQPAATDAAAAD